MKLEQLTLRQRVGLLILVVIIVLLAMMFLVPSEQAPGQAITESSQLYQGIPLDAHLLRLDRRALEEAYHQQVIFLFTVCLKDGCENTTYFANGMANARRFYSEAAKQIAVREKELIEKGITEDTR
jgi:hypothetical protein